LNDSPFPNTILRTQNTDEVIAHCKALLSLTNVEEGDYFTDPDFTASDKSIGLDTDLMP
jgi:hypothetical protein